MPINFTIVHNAKTNDESDDTGDVAAIAVTGWLKFVAQLPEGMPALAPAEGAGGTSYWIRSFDAYLDADGVLKTGPGGTPGVRIWGNDPKFNLEQLPYLVYAPNGLRANGKRVEFTPFVFNAPSVDVTMKLSQLQPVPSATAEGIPHSLSIVQYVGPAEFSAVEAMLGVSPPRRCYVARTLTGARMAVDSAPVGSALTVEVQHFGGAVWETLGALEIADGSVLASSVTFSQVQKVGDLLRLNTTSVGSSSAATGVAVEVLFATVDTGIGGVPGLGFIPEDSARKGQPNGYAGLDSSGTLPKAILAAGVQTSLGLADTAVQPGDTHAAANKATPADADEIPIADSQNAFALGKTTIGALKTLITAAIVSGAPGLLDTLDELAAALGDDENFATTVTNAIAGKQPKFMTGTCATAASTVAKAVTLDSPWASVTPAVGDFFLITYTLGHAIAAATMSINGSAAIPLKSNNGATNSTNLAITSGGAQLYRYNGTVLEQFGTAANFAEISSAEIIATADANSRLMSGRRAEDLMVNEATKARTLTAKTISGFGNTLTLNTNPESTGVSMLPNFYNDLAFNVLRGGSVSSTKNGSPFSFPTGGDNWFKPDASFTSVSSGYATSDTFVITVGCAATLTYNGYYGIVMPDGWYAKNVTIEVYYGGSWSQVYAVTNSSSPLHMVKVTANNGTPITQLRYTLTNLYGTGGFRISSLFAFDFDSKLLSEGYVMRDGGALYGPIAHPNYTTAGRPSASSSGRGAEIFDTTLNKPTWSDGTNWRDAAGTIV